MPGDLADRETQRGLVRELTNQADTIVVATAIRDGPSEWSEVPQSTPFRVSEVLKGPVQNESDVTYLVSRIGEVNCTVSSMFSDAWVQHGQTYLLYIRDKRLLRAGRVKRKWPEITNREEIRLVRKTLKRLDV
jgi:hypothetical protein